MSPAERGEFAGRLAVVTGAARGIGAAVAEGLARRGARVVAVDRDEAALRRFSDDGCTDGLALEAWPLDLRDTAAVSAMVDQVEARSGPIEVLVNVAAILHLAEVTEMASELWHETFDVNLHGVFHLTAEVARRMKGRGRGSIVTVGSNAAAVPRIGMAAYAASKAAATHFTKCLGLELAEHGVRCNVVSPGSTDTAMQRQLWTDGRGPARVLRGSLEQYRTGIPLQRIADPRDIAEAVLFLASDRARQITLHDLRVDGGATLDA